MREIVDTLAKAVKELDNDKVNFETYCATGDKDISQAEFPTTGVKVRSERDVSVWEKAQLAALAQR